MYVAVDIGGTRTRIASSNSLIDLTISNYIEYINTHNFEQDYYRIDKELTSISDNITGIGIGIAGDVNEKKNIVYSANWNQEYENKDFLVRVKKKFNCPVYMNNDAVVAALGIAYYGDDKNKDFIYITWGTGIGGAVVNIKEEKPISEKLNWEIFFEMWEEKCGGRNLENKYKKHPSDLSEYEWNEIMINFKEELFQFIRKIPHIKLIVFGGGVSIKQQKRINTLKESFNIPLITVSNLEENTGIYGAFGLLRTKLVLNNLN